jgi:uncharacterized RDD family membrane protein YckC
VEGSGSLPPRPQPSIPARLAGAGARAGQRAAELTGIDNAVQLAAEEAIVSAAESPAVERALVRVLQGPAVREAAAGALKSEEVEQAIIEALDSELVDRVWAELLDSDQVQLLIERIAEAPEVRAAITQQGLGLIDDIGRQLAKVARQLDDGLERFLWRLIRRKPRAESPPQAGAITRALAFAVDVLLLDAILLGISGAIALVANAFGDSGNAPTSAVVAGAGVWMITGAVYLVGFWGLSGQTPGMRFLDIRLDINGTRRIGTRKAVRRLIGLGLSALTLGLPLLGIVFSRRRRGLPDRMADTEVLYEPRLTRASSPRPGSGPAAPRRAAA